MKHCTLYLPLFFLVISCSEVKNEEQKNLEETYEWEELIDEDLTQWDTYLSYQHQPGYDGSVPLDENGEEIAPIGLNNKDYTVFFNITRGRRNHYQEYGRILWLPDN